MAVQETGSYQASFSGRESRVGDGSVFPGAAVGTLYPWGLGRVSAFSVEVGDLEMLVLITYDVNTETAAGKKRLRQVAKQCVNYGRRVQNSVFECEMDAAKCREVKAILEEIIDVEKDSLRFYYLGNNYRNKVDHIGVKDSLDMKGPLIM